MIVVGFQGKSHFFMCCFGLAYHAQVTLVLFIMNFLAFFFVPFFPRCTDIMLFPEILTSNNLPQIMQSLYLFVNELIND